MTKIGFEVVENVYHRKDIVNRKTQSVMKVSNCAANVRCIFRHRIDVHVILPNACH